MNETGTVQRDYWLVLRYIILPPLAIVSFVSAIWQTIPVAFLTSAQADLYTVVPVVVGTFIGAGVVIFASVLVHELGHAVAAWFVRLPILLINVGGCYFDFTTGRFGYSSEPTGTDGFVLAGPNGSRHLRARMAIFLIGGPLASLLLAALTVWLAAILQPDVRGAMPYRVPWALRLPWLFPATPWVALCNITATVSLLTFIESLLPSAATANDGWQLLGCWTDRPGQFRWMASQALLQDLAKGIRPRDFDPGWLAHLVGDADGSAIQGVADLVRYFHAEDHERTDEAGQLIDRALEARTELFMFQRRGIYLEAAYHLAYQRRDAEQSRFWLNRIPREGIEDHTWLRAEAALRAAEGQRDEALALIDQALAAVPNSKDPGGAIAEKDWLERMRHRLLAEITADKRS